MTEDSEYKDILEANVDEVKKQIRDMDDPDYERLLELEKGNDDRKTVKEFLEKRIDEQEVEVEESSEEVDEVLDTSENSSVDTRYTFAVAGAVLGLIIGASVVAFGPFTGVDATATPDEVQTSVEDYWNTQLEQAQFEGDVTVSEPEIQSRMYVLDITSEGEVQNQTVEETQTVYVTLDGQFMFPQVEQMGQVVSPIDLTQDIEPAAPQQGQQQPEGQQELSEEEMEELEEQLEQQMEEQ